MAPRLLRKKSPIPAAGKGPPPLWRLRAYAGRGGRGENSSPGLKMAHFAAPTPELRENPRGKPPRRGRETNAERGEGG
jgi:hypothetical protein